MRSFRMPPEEVLVKQNQKDRCADESEQQYEPSQGHTTLDITK